MQPSPGNDRGERSPRIILCEPHVLFGGLGIEPVVRGLEAALIERGVIVDKTRIPIVNPGAKYERELLGWRLLDLGAVYNEPIDGVISLGFPAYYVKKENQVVWLLAQPPWMECSPLQRWFSAAGGNERLRSVDIDILARAAAIISETERDRAELAAAGIPMTLEPLARPRNEAAFRSAAEFLLRCLAPGNR